MELKDFGKQSKRWHEEFVASHFPKGKVWARVKDFKLLISSIAYMSSLLWDKMTEIIHGFLPSMASDFFLTKWETSLGLEHTGPLAERRDKVKSQIRKKTVVNVSEFETILSSFLGKTVTVRPLNSDYARQFFIPTPVPTPLFLPYQDAEFNRFAVLITPVTYAERQEIVDIVEKFKQNNTVVVTLDDGDFF